VIPGDVYIEHEDVVLQNIFIEGRLVIGEAVQEGNVTLDRVTVKGDTVVSGGGLNSIFFKDSVIATVIVNKNTGAVRIVAQGDTEVFEVQLEAPAHLAEEQLALGAEGFMHVAVTEALQPGRMDIQLDGVFETINSRATQVNIQLSEKTDIQHLILSTAAAVLGEGAVQLATIHAEGSTLSMRPQNVVLHVESATIAGETINDSYSEEGAVARLEGIRVDQGNLSFDLTHFVADLSLDDFEIVTTLDGEPVVLENVQYNLNDQRLTYTPFSVRDHYGKVLNVEVTPKHRLQGETQSATVPILNGFGGRVTDIHGVGMANAILTFGEHGAIQTDEHGYYSISLPPGTYKGTISGNGYIDSAIVGVSTSDVFLTDQHETGIRAAASNELKIMLEWDEYPHDLDSHLVAVLEDGQEYHTWFNDQIAYDGEQVLADLDWDDMMSYGPETTTIRQLRDGTYRFYVHNYSANYKGILAQSGAVVKIFRGQASKPEQVIRVPQGETDELCWDVFEMHVTNKGQSLDIRKKNELVSLIGGDDSIGELEGLCSPRPNFPGGGGGLIPDFGDLPGSNPVIPLVPPKMDVKWTDTDQMTTEIEVGK